MDRRVVQAVEHRTKYHGDGDSQHGNPAATGGSLSEFRVGLQLIVEAGLATDVVVGERRTVRIVRDTIGIVRMGLVGHELFLRGPVPTAGTRGGSGKSGRFREPGRFRQAPRSGIASRSVLFFNLFRTEPADYSEGDPGSREEDVPRQ